MRQPTGLSAGPGSSRSRARRARSGTTRWSWRWAGSPGPPRRRHALTFLFVGGGYAGVEAAAELEDMARHALRNYPELSPADMRWMLVDIAGRILPEVSPSMSAYTARQLTRRQMEVRLRTSVDSVADGIARLRRRVLRDRHRRVDQKTRPQRRGGAARQRSHAVPPPRRGLGRQPFLHTERAYASPRAGASSPMPSVTASVASE